MIKIHECDREYCFLKIRRVILIHKEGTPRAIMMGKNAIYIFDATKINKQGNYSLRRPPKLIILQTVIRQ